MLEKIYWNKRILNNVISLPGGIPTEKKRKTAQEVLGSRICAGL